ncbi:mitochondrial escape protein 2 [Chytriomyces hyalinus]|nr:mitochondrial escape protein 2 [Chytriomyces hyalinus]
MATKRLFLPLQRISAHFPPYSCLKEHRMLLPPAFLRTKPFPSCVNASGSNRAVSGTAGAVEAFSNPSSSVVCPQVLAVWFDNIYPIRLSTWDPRHWWATYYARILKDSVKKDIIPPASTFKSNFSYLNSVSSIKEGGLLMRFEYDGNKQDAFDTITEFVDRKGLRSMVTLGQKIRAYPVEGEPWIEDLHSSIPSTRINLDFVGPALPIETLYNEFRRFGSMFDVVVDEKSGGKDAPRRGHVQFYSTRSATAARVCLNGKVINGTKVLISYEPALSRNFIFKMLRDHPRISIPIALALLALLSYLIFDPMRVFFITNTVTNRFSVTRYISDISETMKIAVRRFFFGSSLTSDKKSDYDDDDDYEKQQDYSASFAERKIHENTLLVYLKEAPDTAMLVHGPKGTKPSDLVDKCVQTEPYVLRINMDELINQADHVMLDRFADQFGCFPMFNWMVSSGAILDTIIAAGTGSKPGLNSTCEDQIKLVLEYATAAFNNIVTKESIKRQRLADQLEPVADSQEYGKLPEIQYPVVIIEGFLSNEKGRQSFLYELMTEWVSTIVEEHLAHVVFVSDNPSAFKYLGRAVSNKTVETITLKDASHESSLLYVYRRLGLPNSKPLPAELEDSVLAIGGRLTDLEQLLQKMKASLKAQRAAHGHEDIPQEPQLAISILGLGPRFKAHDVVASASMEDLTDATIKSFNDMVVRSETEIRKAGLFEDIGAVISRRSEAPMEWSTVQMWKIVQLLSKFEEISYDDLRFHALFKGDEAPIQAIERAGLISVGHKDGRPFTIKAGRPLYRTAFKRLESDPKYAAIMGLKTTKTIATNELANLSALENELNLITGQSDSRLSWWARGEVRKRVDFLAKKIGESQRKIAALDAEQRKLSKAVKLEE